jgi:hypothetical protein
MQRHSDQTIDLDRTEKPILDLMLQMVAEEGMDVETAAEHALLALPDPDPQFVSWLSQGTLSRVEGRTLKTRFLGEDLHPLNIEHTP